MSSLRYIFALNKSVLVLVTRVSDITTLMVNTGVSLSLQIVCVPFDWRVKLVLIIIVNAAVSFVVEVRDICKHIATVDLFLMFSFCFFMQCAHLCLINWTAGSVLCEQKWCAKVKSWFLGDVCIRAYENSQSCICGLAENNCTAGLCLPYTRLPSHT